MRILSQETVRNLETLHSDEYPLKDGLIDTLDSVVYWALKTTPAFPETDAQQKLRSFMDMIKQADVKDVEQLEYDIAFHLFSDLESRWDNSFFSADTFASLTSKGWLIEILEGRLYDNISKDRYASLAADELFYRSARVYLSHTGKMPAGGELSHFVNLMKFLVGDKHIQEAFPGLGGVRGRCQTAIKQLKQSIKSRKRADRAIENLGRE